MAAVANPSPTRRTSTSMMEAPRPSSRRSRSRHGRGSIGKHRTRTDLPRCQDHSRRARPDFHLDRTSDRYDDTNLTDGEPDSEVYLYEVGAPGPVCVSCNPSGARPLGRMVTVEGPVGVHGGLATAAASMPDTALYSPHILTDNRHRLFFNSFDALLHATATGSRTSMSGERLEPGCLRRTGRQTLRGRGGGLPQPHFVGESPQDSELFDASGNGEDVFFTTNASLLPRDPGFIDVYDAGWGRIRGTTTAACGLPGEEVSLGVRSQRPDTVQLVLRGPGNEGSKKKPHQRRNKKGSPPQTSQAPPREAKPEEGGRR